MTNEDDILAAMAAADFSPAPVRKASPAAPAPKLRASFGSEAWRVIAGGTRDAVIGGNRALDDIDEAVSGWTKRNLGIETYRPIRSSIYGIGMMGNANAGQQLAAAVDGKTLDRALPKVAENQTAIGGFGRDVVEFGVGFASASKQLKALDLMGTVARYGRVTLAGGVAAFNSVDPMQGNLANAAKALGVPENAFLDALAVDEDDGAIEARLKNAATDAAGGIAFDAAFKALGLGVRNLRAVKGAKEAAQRQATVPDAVLDDRMVQSAAKAVDEELAPKEALEAATPDPKITAPDGQMDLFGDAPTAVKPDPADALEESLLGIPRKMEGLDEAGLTALAKSFHEGGGYEVLDRLGLDPARIDFAKVLSEGDPSVARVAEIVERVAEAVQPIANRAGSKPRTREQTAMLANLLGTNEAQVVAAFKDSSSNLDAKAWAARQLLGGSAARLAKLAEKARDFVDNPTAPEYLAFLKSLEAHAALQAQFKAATSNLGRALNSLQGTATAKTALDQARRLKSLVPDSDAAQRLGGSIDNATDALRALGDTTDPKARRALIDKIMKAKGDPAKIGQIAERGQGPARWQRALREFITGNLFSVGTATVNVLSTAGHIGFRALARAPVHGLAYVTGRAGSREYVAARAAESAYFHTLVGGFANGFTRASRLLLNELADEARLVAGSANSNPVERGAARLQKWMDEKWGTFEPRAVRADIARSKEWHVSRETVEALMDNTDQLPALLRIAGRGFIGINAGIFNAVGSTSRLIRTVTIDAVDELMGSVTEQAMRASEASRIAALEGIEKGLSGDALAKFTQTRANVLMAHSSPELLDRIERLVALGAKENSEEVNHLAAEAAHAIGIKEVAEGEARKVLFQDDLSWGVSKVMSPALSKLDGHTGLIFPFVKTPLKILETTLGEYTPLGLLQKETRDRVMSGGIDAQIALTQIGMGSLAVSSAMALAAGGYVVGFDGGPRSSSRMERPQYSVRVGDKWVEFSRFDPFGMLLGFGADMHEYVLNTESEDGSEASWQADKAAEGLMLAISKNILSKTWMTTMREVVGAAGGMSEGEISASFERLLTSTVQKVVPAGGMQRWWEGTDEGVLREASGLWERVLSSTVWADELPVRRDTLLGRPVKYDRILGIQAGDDDKDPVIRELADLTFDLPPNSRSFRGVELTTRQLARLKELRGQVVTDDNGLTMEQTVRELVVAPEWKEMDRTEKVKALRSLRDDYQKIAIDALREEDKQFNLAVGERELRRQLEKQGYAPPEISAELQAFKEEVLGN